MPVWGLVGMPGIGKTYLDLLRFHYGFNMILLDLNASKGLEALGGPRKS